VEDTELIEELMGLSVEAADYHAFWKAKYRGVRQSIRL
jgi:hypothetical protein